MCEGCIGNRHTSSKLYMSTVDETSASDTITEIDVPAIEESNIVAEVEAPLDVDVPSEVLAMDGVQSEDEAHNAERPARKSLKKKPKQRF